MLEPAEHLAGHLQLLAPLPVVDLLKQPRVDHRLHEGLFVGVFEVLHRVERLLAVLQDEVHHPRVGKQLVGREELLAVKLAVGKLHG